MSKMKRVSILVIIVYSLLCVACGPARHTHTVIIRDGEISEGAAIRCPKCNGDNLSSNNRGYSVGKGLTGGLLLGPVGLLFGASGSWQPVLTCLSCGYSWKPEIRRIEETEDASESNKVKKYDFKDGIYK